jgi:hypothetical protein
LPNWDRQLGILPHERAIFNAHIPATYLLREANLNEIALDKAAFFFKPVHGFASHGVLTSSQVGKRRLRQLLKKGSDYVAQKNCHEADADFRKQRRKGVSLGRSSCVGVPG